MNPQKTKDSVALKLEAKRKPNFPELLVHFVKQAVSLAQKRCTASPAAVTETIGHVPLSAGSHGRDVPQDLRLGE